MDSGDAGDHSGSRSPLHVNLAIRRDVSRSTKKDQFYYRDESNVTYGPYDLPVLHLWWANGLLSDTVSVTDVSTQATSSLNEILRSRGLYRRAPDDRNEWFLWTDQKTPFLALNSRINRCLTSRQPKSEMKLLSMLSPSHQANVASFQEFEDYLAQGPTIADKIRDLHLNSFAEPFAMWLYKTFSDLKCEIKPEEVRALLLEVDPDRSRAFIAAKIGAEAIANRFFESFHQWRLFIPCFDPADAK
jgi:hypothetical protein